MFCPECGRELQENEVCHCLEELYEQPNVKIAPDQDQGPRFGVLGNKIYEDNLERMKKEYLEEQKEKNKKEMRRKKNEKEKH